MDKEKNILQRGPLGDRSLPRRKRLPHTPPPWVEDGSLFFITICCLKRCENALAHEPVAAGLFDSIAYRKKLLQWNPHLVLLMPDHLHGFFAFSSHQEMKKTVADWKRYVGRKLKIDWQREFFDHRIRSTAELQEKWSYVLQNPVRAGLCKEASDWQYVRQYR